MCLHYEYLHRVYISKRLLSVIALLKLFVFVHAVLAIVFKLHVYAISFTLYRYRPRTYHLNRYYEVLPIFIISLSYVIKDIKNKENIFYVLFTQYPSFCQCNTKFCSIFIPDLARHNHTREHVMSNALHTFHNCMSS